MDAPRPARLWLALVIAAGILLAIGAMFLSVVWGDPINPLFRHVLTVQVIAVLLAWSVLAWATHLLLFGRLPKLQLTSMPAFAWGGFRIALFVATVTAMVCWLASLALGLAVETVFIRAIVLLVIVTAFTGLIGAAFFNSLLVVRRLRARKTQ